ncbi:MAG: hypothetical protein HamCj_18610 [Candidatus Hamiltonella defensa (Ceratovacuna japonica)]
MVIGFGSRKEEYVDSTEGINRFSADYQTMLRQTGFNAEFAAKKSNQFMTSMKGLTSLFGICAIKSSQI